jgi:hypothetical protein
MKPKRGAHAQPSPEPPPWVNSPEVFESMAGQYRRHLALLQVDVLDHGQPAQAVCTGFFLSWRRGLYWISAAHCVERVKDLCARPGVKVLSMGLVDARQRTLPAIPWDVRDQFLVCPDSNKVDICVARITGNTEDLVRKNPDAAPLTTSALEGCEVVPGVALCLVGHPSEWTQHIVKPKPGGATISMRTTTACLPVTTVPAAAATDDDASFWDNPNCLYRTVTLREGWPSGALESVVGMSGGPIFSLEAAGEQGFRYRLVGLQSRWLKSRRVLRIEPTRAILNAVDIVRRGQKIASSGKPAQ